MRTFSSARDAKEFLIAEIAGEARHQGVSLSETERKMLYFSETAWTLPDIMEINDAFDRDFDQSEYEKKIGALVRSFQIRAREANPPNLDAWDEAVRTISGEDHYLLVLINPSGDSIDSPRDGSPLVDRLKLVALAFAIVVALLAAQFLLRKR